MQNLSWMEKTFSFITPMKEEKGKVALLLCLNLFFILVAYYLIKPVREGWIAIADIDGFTKIEIKAYSSFLQTVVLLIGVGCYAKLADKMDKKKLFFSTTLFFIANILLFWLLQPQLFIEKSACIGIIYYIWVNVFGVFIVAQFWTFCSSLYTHQEGYRLIPIISIGATLGSVAGSWAVTLLLRSQLINQYSLLLIAIVPLLISIYLMWKIEFAPPQQELSNHQEEKINTSIWIGIKLISQNRFLFLAAAISLLSNWVNTNGENLLFALVQTVLENEFSQKSSTSSNSIDQFIQHGTTVFYGDYFLWCGIIAFLFQAFVATKIIKAGGFGAILLALPIIALLSYSIILIAPALMLIKSLKIIENASDFSFNNTAKHILWLKTPNQIKFHAKPAIDTFYMRLGDGLAALTIWLTMSILSISIDSLLLINIILILFWVGLSIALIKEYRAQDCLTPPPSPSKLNQKNSRIQPV